MECSSTSAQVDILCCDRWLCLEIYMQVAQFVHVILIISCVSVTQLINKLDGLPFSTSDENFVEAFAIFSGMGIHNTRMYLLYFKFYVKYFIHAR